jgi:uncharacterized OB-fold protein
MRCGAAALGRAAAAVCPKCGRDDRLEPCRISGEGRLYSFTTCACPGRCENDAPYAARIVELGRGADQRRVIRPRSARGGPRDTERSFDALAIDGKLRLAREEKGVYFFAPVS